MRDAVAALGQREWELLKRLLHPYVRWTDGTTAIRGRTKVLAYLADRAVTNLPARYELRDGQIYRWQANSPDGQDSDDT